MERISEISSATLDKLVQNWLLWAALLGLVAIFAIYVYLSPKAMEFFQGSQKKENPVPQPLAPLRAEPPAQPRESAPPA